MTHLRSRVEGLAARTVTATVHRLRRAGFALFVARAKRLSPEWLRQAMQDQRKLCREGELDRAYREALAFLRENQCDDGIGDYLEFGVFYGHSLLRMYGALADLGLDHVRLFGFDSFEGLPEKTTENDQGLHWNPGMFKADYERVRQRLDGAGVDWNRVKLVKGWFSETLHPATAGAYGIQKASVIMIDCDFHSSAKQALDFCAPLIRDRALIFFDDWDDGVGLAERGLGEKQAFDEFLAEHPSLVAKEFGTYLQIAEGGVALSKIFLVCRRSDIE